MSLSEIQPSDVLRTAAEIVGSGFLLAVPGIAAVTVLHHRELTHENVKLHPLLKKLAKAEMIPYSPEPRIWAAVHLLHHEFPDTTLYPEYQIARAVDYIEENGIKGIEVPDYFPFLDRYVPAFPREKCLEVGHFAIERMKDLLGGTYEPPSSYTIEVEELQDILHPTKPRYFYQQDRRHVSDYTKGEITQDKIARVVLTDPHSPSLTATSDSEQNGVRIVLEDNPWLYSEASRLYRARPDLMPKHLQNEDGSISRNRNFGDFVRGAMLPVVLTLLARGKYEPEDVAIAVVEGGAIYAVKFGFHIAGGNITNGLGHAGEMTSNRFVRAIFNKKYEPKLNPDGTVSTNSVKGGLLGRAINTITFDEVGGQSEHHVDPGKIAFTSQSGIKAWMEAPWGMFLSALARSEHFPLIKEGRGFEGVRPDMPNHAVEIIQGLRVEQMQALK